MIIYLLIIQTRIKRKEPTRKHLGEIKSVKGKAKKKAKIPYEALFADPDRLVSLWNQDSLLRDLELLSSSSSSVSGEV